jgi:hypothetical protein
LLNLKDKIKKSPIKDIIGWWDWSVDSPFILKLNKEFNNFVSDEYAIVKYMYWSWENQNNWHWIKNQTLKSNPIPIDILDVWYIGCNGAMEMTKVYFDLSDVFMK